MALSKGNVSGTLMARHGLRPPGGDVKYTYTGIEVRDLDRAIKFYTEGLGMELLDRHEIHATKGEVAGLRSKGSEQILELNYYEEGSPFATPYVNGEELDHLAFVVPDLRAAVNGLRTKGVVVLVEPFAIGVEFGWREAFVRDPNGIWIELLERP